MGIEFFNNTAVLNDAVMILLFLSCVFFVFLIYVGICVIEIKSGVKELRDLEYKKYEQMKKKEELSEKDESNQSGSSSETIIDSNN